MGRLWITQVNAMSSQGSLEVEEGGGGGESEGDVTIEDGHRDAMELAQRGWDQEPKNVGDLQKQEMARKHAPLDQPAGTQSC